MTTRYDILPTAQRQLLPELRGVRKAGYVLYGGTAVALHLGHRRSIDFDFLSSDPLDELQLVELMPTLATALPLQRAHDTWTVQVRARSRTARPVKLSFYGGFRFGRVGVPQLADNGEVLLASKLDLLGHKLNVLLQRIEAKDYRDVAALLRSGVRLEVGLGAASALFGPAFPPADALRTLTYFDGGDLARLSKRDRDTLTAAAAHVSAMDATPIVLRKLI